MKQTMDRSKGGSQWTMPNLYLTVSRVSVHGEPALDFSLSGSSLGRPVEPMGSSPLTANFQTVLDDMLEQWEDISHESAVTGNSFQNDILKNKGCYLFQSLLPQALQERLWDLRHEADDLIIESAEAIPWELLYLQDPHSNDEDTFLCRRFHMARWLPQKHPATSLDPMPALNFKLTPMAMIRGQGVGLSASRGELEHIEANHPHWQPTRIESSYQGVSQALTSGLYGSWHFVGHGHLGETAHREVSLILESAEELKPETLAGSCRHAGRTRPLAFWNCCYSVRTAQIFGLSGWAEAFVKNGFGAFVGTLWAVQDKAAHVFSSNFYQALYQGRNLGEAMEMARVAVQQEGSEDWLAYVLYGDPRARYRSENAERPSPELLLKEVGDGPAFQQIHKPLLEVLAVIRESIPAYALAEFAGVKDEEVAVFLKHWKDHLQQGKNSYYPRSTMRGSLKAWADDKLLNPEEANLRIVMALMEKTADLKINLNK